MRIAVTGATGNIGSRLLPLLLADPAVDSVVGIARRLPADRDPAVDWRSADVASDDLGPALRGADVVVHLAFLLQPAHDQDRMRRTNVLGTQRVIDTVVAEGVPALVHASSVGTYAPGPNEPRVSEDHPATGISTSPYSRHKAACEAALDDLEAGHPERRVVRIRPALVLEEQAASAIARYFLGPFVPQTLVRRQLLPVVPAVPGLAIQAVHTTDAARAFALAATRPVSGPFNIAAEPVLDPPALARLLGARLVPVPLVLARGLVDLTWRLHLQPTDPGWIDLATAGPLMDTTRARTVLGWEPEHDAGATLLELLRGFARGAGADTPVLRPRAGGPRRLAEAVRALVPGAGGAG